ncbi:hypothetical protein CY35_03G068600 [Sphagnum magellanicum]|nr:hypothetical protein CY35_03G068600 [Sphagnum magellanicum]
MPIPHLLLIGSFWKNSCARFLVAGFCITAHYFSIFPLNWVVDLHCRYWTMDCRHRFVLGVINRFGGWLWEMRFGEYYDLKRVAFFFPKSKHLAFNQGKPQREC